MTHCDSEKPTVSVTFNPTQLKGEYTYSLISEHRDWNTNKISLGVTSMSHSPSKTQTTVSVSCNSDSWLLR
jgi:hypothetical protein